jgi:subtilisin family serine protease
MTDATDDDNFGNYGHGHSAISVMASTANNGSGIAGINSTSQVMVHDVYGRSSQSGVTLMQAIESTISYARANNLRVVFQGGFQGESWLTNGFFRGGTRSQFEQLIRNNADIAMFAIAAGNGGPGGNLNDPNYLTSVSGVAKLETTHNNVISVGAVQAMAQVNEASQWQIEWSDGLMNATTLNLAPYSNRGSNLTLVAPTDAPAMDKFGDMRFFGGTSAANPNLAGIASLVWSVNPQLTGSQVRQILIDTAMDLGSVGRDNTFGYGLVNADAAVRRAFALVHDSELADLYAVS